MTELLDTWQADFSALESAEEYCEFFGIDYDKTLLGRNRMGLLQSFHNLLPSDWGTLEFVELRRLFALAYSGMAVSSAREEQLFKVFKTPVYGISIDSIGGRRKGSTCH